MNFDLQSLASLATAAGAVFAGWQLWLVQRQSVTQFEDGLSAQYREIMRRLPLDAILGRPLSEEAYAAALPAFFHYFDLCNEQAFLRNARRVRRSTWVEWEQGIKQNLARPAFRRAWAEVAAAVPDSFDELRAVVAPAATSGSMPPPPPGLPPEGAS